MSSSIQYNRCYYKIYSLPVPGLTMMFNEDICCGQSHNVVKSEMLPLFGVARNHNAVESQRGCHCLLCPDATQFWNHREAAIVCCGQMPQCCGITERLPLFAVARSHTGLESLRGCHYLLWPEATML